MNVNMKLNQGKENNLNI